MSPFNKIMRCDVITSTSPKRGINITYPLGGGHLGKQIQ